MQFDNGECGLAMIELYALTRDAKYLTSALKAADWSISRPLVPNWNYNSFSVRLLARAHAITGEAKYLDAAVHKARLGVIPGQLRDGQHEGRWFDAHKARPTYHYIMMAALAELAAVMPVTHPHRPEVLQSLRLGLLTRNQEIVTIGVMNKDSAMDALLSVQQCMGNDEAFMRDTSSTAALRVLALLVSAEAQRGKFPMSPGNWGRFLERTNNGGTPLPPG
jgi:hypothetical protein